MTLFQLGDFTLSSGARSQFKIECDALTPADWKTLAVMVRDVVGPFSSVEGVPRGGLALAAQLEPFVSDAGPLLLVDDVLTSGGSMERLRAARVGEMVPVMAWCEPIFQRTEASIIGAVVFARGACHPWIKPLFQLPEALWVKEP